MSLCAFVLSSVLYGSGARLLLESQNAGTPLPPRPPFEVIAEHQTRFNKSVPLSCTGPAPFRLLYLKALEYKKLFIFSEPLKKWKLLHWCGRRILFLWDYEKKTSVARWIHGAGHERKVEPFSGVNNIKMDSNPWCLWSVYTQGQTAFHIWDLSVGWHASLPPGLFGAAEKHTLSQLHITSQHEGDTSSSRDHSHRQERKGF